MKVGIITLFDLNNVGNRLQNYAVTSVLKKMGFECETLVPHRLPKTPYRMELDKQISELMLLEPCKAQEENSNICRALRFESFTDEFIPWKELSCSQFGKDVEKDYDFFVTGSDQVWNPYFKNAIGQIENRLLAFAPPQKRVCFAPSIGVDDIPKSLYELYEREWSEYRCLSAREKSGCDLINKITGRDATVVIDPTLMIDVDEWLSMAQPMPGFDYEQEYVLFYFLGEPEEEMTTGMKEFIQKEVVEKNIKIVRLFDKEDRVMNSTGPAQILDLFSHAKMICTDSFHGTVFSILLGRPFVLADRTLVIGDSVINMSGRIHTLLDTLGLNERLPKNEPWTLDSVWKADYDKTYELLEVERKKAMEFLNRAFGREDIDDRKF